MTQIEKIKAEIERLKDETWIGISEYDQGVENGRIDVLNTLLKFTDSLSMEEPSEDLDKEFNDFLDYNEGVPRMWHSDEQIEWAKDIAVHFAQWQKEQIMKHTIEGCYIRRNRYTKTNVLNGLNVTDKVFQNFKDGDELRLIVIKEGEIK